jgi:hypothetical protein
VTRADVTLTALEYESLLLFAVRHALRGRTYAPGFVARQLLASASKLTNAGLDVIGQDIQQRIDLGEPHRLYEWRRALDAVRMEQAARDRSTRAVRRAAKLPTEN